MQAQPIIMQLIIRLRLGLGLGGLPEAYNNVSGLVADGNILLAHRKKKKKRLGANVDLLHRGDNGQSVVHPGHVALHAIHD